IRRNLEAYVDDMVIKSNDDKVLIVGIAETFDNNAIKGQFMSDFLSEASVGTLLEAFFRLPARVQSNDDVERWNLFTDGESNSKGSGASFVLISPSGAEFKYALQLNFTSTNNEAEYKALLAGLCMALKIPSDLKGDAES
ncbi:reverse transcriptase domain-containing protein, partial [Tanacetum coccineum]